MNPTGEPKYTCKCGQVFDLYGPLANVSPTNATSTADNVRKPARKAYPAHVHYSLDHALFVVFGIAAVCWTYMIYDYVRSIYI
jgi:hypothetical protein